MGEKRNSLTDKNLGAFRTVLYLANATHWTFFSHNRILSRSQGEFTKSRTSNSKILEGAKEALWVAAISSIAGGRGTEIRQLLSGGITFGTPPLSCKQTGTQRRAMELFSGVPCGWVSGGKSSNYFFSCFQGLLKAGCRVEYPQSLLVNGGCLKGVLCDQVTGNPEGAYLFCQVRFRRTKYSLVIRLTMNKDAGDFILYIYFIL